MEFSVDAWVRAGQGLVCVAGELDVGTAPQLGQALAEVLRLGGALIVLDLAGVTFMDCTGLGVVLRARDASLLRGGGLRLVGMSARVRTLLTLTGTQSLAVSA
jgi:anti-sigma B factor antagonist